MKTLLVLVKEKVCKIYIRNCFTLLILSRFGLLGTDSFTFSLEYQRRSEASAIIKINRVYALASTYNIIFCIVD